MLHQLLTLYLSYGVKYQSRVIWGHWGQKVILTKHDITHPCYLQHDHKTHTHVDQLESVYLCYGVKCQSGVIWGHWGQKVIFTINVITSSMLHSMIIRLIHVHQR